MDRRELLKSAGSVAGLAVASVMARPTGAAEKCDKEKPRICFKDEEEFLGPDGKSAKGPWGYFSAGNQGIP